MHCHVSPLPCLALVIGLKMLISSLVILGSTCLLSVLLGRVLIHYVILVGHWLGHTDLQKKTLFLSGRKALHDGASTISRQNESLHLYLAESRMILGSRSFLGRAPGRRSVIFSRKR
ncbi:hypothetical protein BS47DRAFT_525750 [Hydnum rufescens UP504]|uniref:Uncharacterized protein n=1 Tax=Hydnum rufescens UP504 TaxID=1448309 RepID=A0A9P6E027_9AGAM|nr:hypothetical protein BS47DRAFT_525750 [Hydnum rufescens UP504]